MEQIERIRYMEGQFDLAQAAMKELPTEPEKFTKLREAMTILSEYYSSHEWKQDYADDEAGLLPNDLKRGVLSEDGLWNILSDWHELEIRMQRNHS